MNSFKIGNTEFGIGKISFSIKSDLLTLEINGNDDVFDELMKSDNCKVIVLHHVKRRIIMSEEIGINHNFFAIVRHGAKINPGRV